MIIETDVPFRIGTLGDFIVFSSLWEPQVRNIFRFHENMIFLDVGAHDMRNTSAPIKTIRTKENIIILNFRNAMKNRFMIFSFLILKIVLRDTS